VVDVEKPRDTVLDVTVRDDVDDRGRDVVVVDGVYDAGSADRCAPPGLALFEIFFAINIAKLPELSMRKFKIIPCFVGHYLQTRCK